MVDVLDTKALQDLTEVLLLQEAGRWDADAVNREAPWSALCNDVSGRDVAILARLLDWGEGLDRSFILLCNGFC